MKRDSPFSPSSQSGRWMLVIAAIAVAFVETPRGHFKDNAASVIEKVLWAHPDGDTQVEALEPVEVHTLRKRRPMYGG